MRATARQQWQIACFQRQNVRANTDNIDQLPITILLYYLQRSHRPQPSSPPSHRPILPAYTDKQTSTTGALLLLFVPFDPVIIVMTRDHTSMERKTSHYNRDSRLSRAAYTVCHQSSVNTTAHTSLRLTHRHDISRCIPFRGTLAATISMPFVNVVVQEVAVTIVL